MLEHAQSSITGIFLFGREETRDILGKIYEHRNRDWSGVAVKPGRTRAWGKPKGQSKVKFSDFRRGKTLPKPTLRYFVATNIWYLSYCVGNTRHFQK